MAEARALLLKRRSAILSDVVEFRRSLAGYETMPSPSLTDTQLNAIVSEHGLKLDGPIVRMKSSGVVHSLWSLGSRWVLRVPKNEAMCLGDHRCEAVAIPLARMAGVRTPSLVAFDDSGSLLDVPFSIVTRVDGDDLVGATFDHHAYERVGRELARLHASDLADHDHPWLRTPTLLQPSRCSNRFSPPACSTPRACGGSTPCCDSLMPS